MKLYSVCLKETFAVSLKVNKDIHCDLDCCFHFVFKCSTVHFYFNSCLCTIDGIYFKRNWKPQRCIRSFNLLYQTYKLIMLCHQCLLLHIIIFLPTKSGYVSALARKCLWSASQTEIHQSQPVGI